MKIKEEEIRPERVYNEYLELTQKDIITFFANSEVSDINCPACGETGDLWTSKAGFSYKKCNSCLSIYVSPRPVKEAFDAYYTDSPSTKFWATTFYKVTESSRREKLWKPKAQLIKDRIKMYEGDSPVTSIIDIGGGYGVFDEEIGKIMDVRTVIIEPSMHLALICVEKGLEVIEKFMEDITPGELPRGKNCFVSFELFEHLHDPAVFLKTVLNAMKKDDLFIFTTLSGMGLDIRVLGSHAKALSPPHHLNFLNPKSVSLLLSTVGFEVLEAITPGKLDLDILKRNKEHIKDEFWKNLVAYASEEQLDILQKALADSGFSSHMMITCRKK
jgi:SAM-dependent methyltransferase